LRDTPPAPLSKGREVEGGELREWRDLKFEII
jgi:hypothetical protein